MINTIVLYLAFIFVQFRFAKLSQQKAINFVTSLLVDAALSQFSSHGDFRLAVWGGARRHH